MMGTTREAARRAVPWGLVGMISLMTIVEGYIGRNDLDFRHPWGWDWKQTVRAIGREARGCEVLCFGDSLVKYGVVPRVLEARLGRRAYNLAVANGQAPTAYFLLRRALEAGARPAAVLIDGELLADDRPAWDAQRAGQRSADGTVVKISGLPGRLPAVLSAAERLDARVVGRAALGLSWVTLPQREPAAAAAAVAELRAALAPAPCVVLDATPETRARVEGWGVPESPVTDLMRRLKQRFDPAGICNPGAFVGGI